MKSVIFLPYTLCVRIKILGIDIKSEKGLQPHAVILSLFIELAILIERIETSQPQNDFSK